MKNIRCVLLGFSVDETILSTVVDGFHRSHRYQIVSDAVACRASRASAIAASYKLAVVKVIGNYAGILEAPDLVGSDAARLRYERKNRDFHLRQRSLCKPFGEFDD